MGADVIFILFLALIIFGPKRLPQLAREVGRFVGEFKRASNDFKSQLQAEIDRAGEGNSTRRSPQLPAQSEGAESSGTGAPTQSPALPASTAEAMANPLDAAQESDRERLLRIARFAAGGQDAPSRPPLVPDTGSEPPPAPPMARPGDRALAAEENENRDAVVNASLPASPAPAADNDSAHDESGAAVPAPPKS